MRQMSSCLGTWPRLRRVLAGVHCGNADRHRRHPGAGRHCGHYRAVNPITSLVGSFDPTQLNNPCVNQQPQTLDRAGARGACASAEGVFDLTGNLDEWTAGPAGTFRGGYYVDTVLDGPGCLYTTTAHDTSYHDYSTGFRCCSDAPAAMLLPGLPTPGH